MRKDYFLACLKEGYCSHHDNFCYLLISSTNSLDQDQAGEFVWPDLVPNCLSL